MVVEVTLQDVKGGRRQPQKNKACWFPFKKQYDGRKKASWQAAEDYDYDGVDWGKGGGTTPSDRKSGKNHNKNHSRRSQKQKQQAGSVSTGTEDASSYGGYSNESSSPTRGVGYYDAASASLASQSHLSYQTGNTSFVEEDAIFTSSNNSVVRSIASFDEDEDSILEMGPDGMPIMNSPEESSFPLELAMVETNCMTKTFWVDEMVEGGAFACLQQRPTKKTTEQTSIEVVQMTPPPKDSRKGVTFDAALAETDFKIVQEVKEEPQQQQPTQLDQHIQQRLLEVNHEDISAASRQKQKRLQYVSQEPENIQQGPALQRAMCSRARLGNKKQSRQKQKQQRQQDMKNNSSLSQMSSISSSQPSSQNQTDYSSGASNSVEASFLRGGAATLKRGSYSSSAEVQSSSSSSSSRQQSSRRSQQQPRQLQPIECFSQPCANYPSSSGPELPKTPEEDEKDAPNFYVEVEAMQAQLNGIRDLEVIEAEDKQLEQEIGLARTSSLVDGDSTFMDSVFEDAASDSEQNNTKTRETKASVKNRGKFSFWKRSRSSVQQQSRQVETSPLHHPSEQKKSLPTVQQHRSSSRQLADRSRATHSAQELPIKRVSSSTRAKDNSIRRNSGPVDIDEVSISQKVAERLKKMENGKTVPSSQTDTNSPSPAAAKYYQRREKLGLADNVVSPERVVSRNVAPEPSSSPHVSESSPPSSIERLDAISTPSFESPRVKPTELPPPMNEQRMSSPPRPVATRTTSNHRGINSDYRGRIETNVAHDAYFGRQKPTETEFGHSAASYPEFNAFGDGNDKNQIAAQAHNFEDDFWKDDDASEINSAAFEEYDGDDSLFGDLRSNAESKVSKQESQPSRMSFPKQDDFFNDFNDPVDESGGSEEFHESGDGADFDKLSRADRSKYTTADQSEYTRYTADYTEDPSRYTVEDESRYRQDTSMYTTDFSRFSRHGDTSFVSKTSRGADKSFVSKTSRGTLTTNATNDVSAYLDDGDGEFVAAIDKWLY
ncbi:MAG: hypothetical protein SGILL_002892 [Bacillariaceae sp.]